VEYIYVGFKRMHPSKERWIDTKNIKELYPHMFIEYFWDFGGPK